MESLASADVPSPSEAAAPPEQTQGPDQLVSVTVLSWNLQLLSPQAGRRKKRAVQVAAAILAAKPDIVLLQASPVRF